MTIFGWAGYQIAQRQYLLDNERWDFVRTALLSGLDPHQAISPRTACLLHPRGTVHRVPDSADLLRVHSSPRPSCWPGIGKWSIDAIVTGVNV